MLKSYEVPKQIKEKLLDLPMLPGVYLMYDIRGHIIYVGKSKVLKNRVTSYFRGVSSHTPKVQTMVVNVDHFDYIITDTEIEALILEANLIKKYQPRFNILLKDDKSYPYIEITMDDSFPRVLLTRSKINKKSMYFGPYISTENVRIAVEVIQTLFPIRECNRKITEKVQRPCLNYHIGRCAGVCNHKVDQSTYKGWIDEIIQFLKGNYKTLLKAIEEEMNHYAEQMKFEEAAKKRDQMIALKSLSEKQKVMISHQVNQDYIGFYKRDEQICFMVFELRDGKIDAHHPHYLESGVNDSDSELMASFIMQYYGGDQPIPKEIFLSHAFDSMETYRQWISQIAGYKVKITVPLIGEKKKTVEMASKNAKEHVLKFKEKIQHEREKKENVEGALKILLDYPESVPIRRIEAYDISNISGVYNVGSRVVFQDGQKKKNEYRRYKIKSITGPDDYGSMKEMIYRRFVRGQNMKKEAENLGVNPSDLGIFPDLILVDGGVGHVNAVENVLEELKIHVPVVGMVKNDKHQTEELYYDGQVRGLKSNRIVYRFISEIQDEVHRFTIEYHRKLRSQEMVHSVLENIEGIGAKKRKRLLQHFKSVENIKKASCEELMEVKGISKSLAQLIRAYFDAC